MPGLAHIIIIVLTIACLSNQTTALGINKNGTRILFQHEVESILVRTNLSKAYFSLNFMKLQQQIAANDILTTLDMGKLPGQDELRLTKITASWRSKINVAIRKFNSIFRHNESKQEKDISEKEKRALEFIGNMLSGLTGVPSAEEHRQVLSRLQMLKLDNDGLSDMMSRTTHVNKEILRKLHIHEKEMKNLGQKNNFLENLTAKNKNGIDLVLSLLSFQQTADAELYKIEEAIFEATDILHLSNSNLLSESAISHIDLQSIIAKIQNKYTDLQPVYAAKQVSNYYRLPTVHSWPHKDSFTLFSLIQVPMINYADINKILVLPTSFTLHPELDLAVIDMTKNSFRFMSDSEYKDCLDLEDRLICQKREIKIFPKDGCDLRTSNLDCNDWDLWVIHDIKPTEILIHFKQGPQNALIECDNLPRDMVKLPESGIITLGAGCAVTHERFHIQKIQYSKFITHDSSRYQIRSSKWHNLKQYEAVKRKDLDSLLNETDISLNELADYNNETRTILSDLRDRSDDRWNEVQNYTQQWEKIVMWIIISLNLLLTIFLIALNTAQTCAHKKDSNSWLSVALTGGMATTAAQTSDIRERCIKLHDDVAELQAWSELVKNGSDPKNNSRNETCNIKIEKENA